MATDHLTCGEAPISRIGLRRFSFPVLLMLLCVSASMTFAAADAMSQSADFDIAPQAMESALHEWSRQSNVQVMVASHDVSGQRTDGVAGRLTAASALAKLLQQTNLTYEPVGNNTVTVKRVAAATKLKDAEREQTRLRKQGETRDPVSGNSKQQRGALEEVIVTAQKRDERLQDVPISISVLGGDHLDRSTVSGMQEVLSRVPGVTLSQFVIGGGTQVPIRGVAAGLPVYTGASPTAYYLDSVPFGFVKSAIGPDPDVYDLERIEVLRGPQGTLYGANALNGVVRVLTQGANLDALEFKARTSASSTQHGGENYRGDVSLNVPIVDGKLAARAVVGYQKLGGWIDRPNEEDANDAERRNLRLKVNAQPTDKLSLAMSAWSSRSNYGAPSLGFENQTTSLLIDEPTSTDYDAFGLVIGYTFPSFSIVSTTSYLNYTNVSLLGINATGSRVIDSDLEADTAAQEITLNSTPGGPWRWSLGGMYRDSEDSVAAFIEGLYAAPNHQVQRSKSYAVFGEVTRSFNDDELELTAGLRYFHDDVAQRERSRFTGVPRDQLISSDSTFDALTPRVALTWHPSERMTAYASYSEGFRSGSDQNPTVLQIAPFPPVEPDTLKNYEVGVKGSLLGGRLNFDTALYYIDWKDVQQGLTVEISPGVGAAVIVNGKSASGPGVDFAITARPTDGIDLGINFSWNDLSVDSNVSSGAIVLFEKGDRLSYSTEYTAGAFADYAFPIGRNGFEGSLSASVNHTSEQPTTALVAGAKFHEDGDALWIGRTNFSIRTPGRWVATVFVDNVSNEQGSPTKHWNPWRDVRVRPRTMGVQLDYHY